MYSLTFFNHFGNGDIFESREFVKEWTQKVDPSIYQFFYAHGKSPWIIKDMVNIKSMEMPENLQPTGAIYQLGNGQSYAINTWIGRESRFVLPGIGCVVEQLYKMHNEMMHHFGVRLEKDIIDYIPKIDFTYYHTEGVHKFLERYYYARKIYISNGNVQSMQANNFDFDPILKNVIEKYPNYVFLVTNRTNLKYDNLFYTGDVINSPNGFDLNECGYLSTFCDTIIGRNSGPHVFAQHYDNWMDETKATLSFTYTEVGATFVLEQPVKMKKYWSDATDVDGVTKKIMEVIER